MENYLLPRDIHSYVIKCRAKLLIRFFAILLFCLIVAIYYREEIFPFWLSLRRTILFVILCISPFVFTGVPFNLFDSNWRGEVVDIKYHTRAQIYTLRHSDKYAPARRVTAKISEGWSSRRPVPIYSVVVTAKTADGSIKRVKVNTFGKTLSDYKTGDTVIHFKGLKQLLVISKKDDGILNCVICGCNNPKTRDTCFGCGHTLLTEYDK